MAPERAENACVCEQAASLDFTAKGASCSPFLWMLGRKKVYLDKVTSKMSLWGSDKTVTVKAPEGHKTFNRGIWMSPPLKWQCVGATCIFSHQIRLLYNSKHLFTWPMGTPVGSFLKPGATEPIKVGHSSFNFLPFLRIFGPRLSSLCGSHFCHEFLFDKDWRGHRNNLKTLLGFLSF